MTPANFDNTSRRWAQLLGIVIIVGVLQTLAYYAVIGTNARFFADDYCIASSLVHDGFFKAWSSIYFVWSGRFTYHFLAFLLQAAGSMIVVPYLPGMVLVVWLVVATLTLVQLHRLSQILFPVGTAILLAGVLGYATIDGTFNVIESLFWRTGMLTYLAPLILFTGYVGLIANRYRAEQRVSWLWLGVSFGVAFLASGFSETFAAMQLSLLGLGVFACWVSRVPKLGQRLLPLLLAGLIGAILGTVIVVLAPGNAVRQAYFAPPSGIISLLVLTNQATWEFFQKTLATPMPLLTALILPAVVAFLPHNRPQPALTGWLLAVLPAAAGVAIWTSLVPAVYGMSKLAPERALITPYAALVVFAMVWGYLAGRLLSTFLAQRRPQAQSGILFKGVVTLIVAAIMFVGPVMSTIKLLDFSETAAAYAQAWDQRDAFIRAEVANGNQNLEVPRLPYMADIDSNPESWINRCMADTYGLQSIKTR